MPVASSRLTLSNFLTVSGILVTIGSIGWGLYQQFHAQKLQTQTARKEAKHLRQLLMKQRIAEQFASAPQLALDLARAVRSKRWEASAESALKLSAELATLRGAKASLVGEEHRGDLDTALAVLNRLNARLPSGDTAIDDETAAEFSSACNVVVIGVHAIRRTLTIRAALGGDHDGD